MSLPIVFAPEAKIDLEEAADYYEIQQIGLGELFLRAVDTGLARIQRFPNGFQRDDREIRTAFLHRFPYGVRFRLLDDRIEIIAIWHERRNPRTWAERVGEDASYRGRLETGAGGALLLDRPPAPYS